MPLDSPFKTFLKTIITKGLEYYGIYYGCYRATVTRNDDPQSRGRIQAICPSVGHDQAPDLWIDPSFAGAGVEHGFFWPPEVGDSVRVMFENGDAARPDVYLGGWYGTEDTPDEVVYSNTRPERRGFITRMGHSLLFTDEPDKERVRLLWHKPDPGDVALTDEKKAADRGEGEFSFLAMNPDGSVQLVNKKGSNINIDAENEALVLMDQHGNTATLDGEGIKLIDKGGLVISLVDGEATIMGKTTVHLIGEKVNIKAGNVFVGEAAAFSPVHGEKLVLWLQAHTHPTGVGPSGPPITPATNEALLSKAVKVS